MDWEGRRCPEARMERGWGGHCQEGCRSSKKQVALAGGLEIRPAGSLRAPRRDREALTQVRWLHASQSPPAPMQRRQVGSPGFNELPPLQADKTQPTRGAARRHPGEPRPHPTTSRVTHLKPTTHCSALGSSKSQTTTPNSRSSLWRMTDALQAAGPDPKPSLEDTRQC